MEKYHINKDCFLNPLAFGNSRLYQIGRLFCERGGVIPRHCQLNYFELTVVTEGEGTVITNGVELKLRPGDIHLSLAGDFHEIQSDKSSALHYDYISLNTVDEELGGELEYINSSCRDEKNRIIRDAKISDLVARAIEEITEGQALYERILTSLLDEILSRLVRAYKASDAPKSKEKLSDTQLLCWQIMNYIDSHVYTIKSLTEISEVTGYNYNYASNIFKAATGETVMNYYRSKRLKAAALLLEEDKLSITEVASLLNYSSVYSFSRAFKERYGVSPSKHSHEKKQPFVKSEA